MTAYALAHFRDSRPHVDLIAYVERIQATLDPYAGRFLVHGGAPDVVEGEWRGSVVMIEFPGRAEAEAWYASPAYQEILPLRTDHVVGDIVIVDGVGPNYDPAQKAAVFREALAAEAAA
ncbi:DUF1330 domain-containing protein [Streptomyces sp. LX-29]|uniref:DUF1330 domain-containing protein n=1 Tax=Streptomyces sp. LX-29 TaxID=2900152 RepID=UPI00240DC260|nr:DUF1330 domain-containing protein [Streptomyces sp. LX-29]WFB07695.1 DUF1330 domain-containing protein [Streptomyces sp. LX-29]